MQRLFILLLLSLILPGYLILFAQETNCCDREAILYCEYNHAFLDNTQEEKIEKEFSTAVFQKFNELFSKNCFQIILPMSPEAANLSQNEYKIEVKYTQVTNITKWPDIRIEATLFFVGEGYDEQVETWEVEEPGDSLTVDKVIWPSFLDKLANKINNGAEITEIIERFEKRPVTVDVGCDKEDFEPGEVVDVFLTGFKGKYGQTSREFNRIMVQVSEGDIINGATCELGEDYKVFKVENDFIKISYKAPGDCGNLSVKFTIYNSCDILSEEKLWLNVTQINDRITEKDYALSCYDAKVSVKGTYDKQLDVSDENTSDEYVHTHHISENIGASATVYLTLIETQDMPVLNQTFQYYKPTSINVSAINYNYNEKKYFAGPDYETNVDYNRSVTEQELDGKENVKQWTWMLVIDNETNEAVKLIPAGFNINYEILETEIINSVHGQERESSSSTRNISKSFKLGPVGESVPDPTIKTSDTWIQDYLEKQGVEIPEGVPIPNISNQETIKKIQPDIIAKFGDHKTSFGGEGSRKIEKELENGKQEENLFYSWSMTLKEN